MSTAQVVSSKYQLKWLHDEIDLYDRKLAHFDKYGAETPTATRSKLETKRSTLEKTARKLAAEGVEFDPKDLPRSFRETTTA
jgi:hypothetical protein